MTAPGYIKLHRSILQDGLWQMLSEGQKVGLVTLLLEVNWAPGEFGCRRCHRVIQQPAGSTSKSAETLAAAAGVSPSTMKRLLGLLCEKGFLINESRTRCHALYMVKNWAKYQSDDEPREPRLTPRLTPGPDQPRPQSRPCEEELRRKEEEETTTAVGGELFSKPQKVEPPPPDSAVATADFLREALLAAGAAGHGWRQPITWSKKRASWARALNGAAIVRSMSQEAIRELVTWGLAAPGWQNTSGEEWTWLRVLDVGDPAAKLAEKIDAIRSSLERAQKAAAPRLSVVDPGGSNMPVYYDGEARITYQQWRERGGLYDDERTARAAKRAAGHAQPAHSLAKLGLVPKGVAP